MSSVTPAGQELIVASVAAIPLAGWLFSARRTPERAVWLVGALALALFSLLGFVWPHVTVVGDAAATGVPVALVTLVCVACIEFCAGDPVGLIYKWRRARKKGVRPGKWVISQTHSDGMVRVAISNGSTSRTIGAADPIEDWDAYIDLKVRAEQAAQTYNGLKVGQ